MKPPLIVVSTCPGRREYLAGTLAALDDAGARDRQKFVAVDGDLDDHPGWPLFVGEERRSSRANLWRAFKLADYLEANQLLYFEDDIRVTMNAVERMMRVGVPEDCAFVSYFDRRAHRRSPGLVKAPPGDDDGLGFRGTQAIVFPARTCKWLLGTDPYALHTHNRSAHVDLVLGELAAQSPWPRIAYHVPALARHIGLRSIAKPTVVRPTNPHSPIHRPITYPGDGFDALSLPDFSAGAPREE